MKYYMEDPDEVTSKDVRDFFLTSRNLLAALFRRRRLVVLTFLAIVLVAVLIALRQYDQYEAQMKILVKRERVEPVVSPAPNALPKPGLPITEEDVASEVELLKSRDLLQRVVVACGFDRLKEDSWWVSLFPAGWVRTSTDTERDKDKALLRAAAALRLEKQLKVVTKANLIKVTYASVNPNMAARVLNTLANLYLEKHLAVHRSSPETLEFFKEESEQYRKEFNLIGTRLADFGRQDGVVSGQLEKATALQKLSEFDAKLQEARASITETEERIRTLEVQVASTPSRQTSQIHINHGALQQLKSTLFTLELKRLELLGKYEPTYEPVQEVEEQIAKTRAAIAAEESGPPHEETVDRNPIHEMLKTELERARTELATLKARAIAIAQTVRTYRENARRLYQNELVESDLIRSSKRAEENYLLYVRKQEEVRISDALDQKRILNVSILEAATIPALPSDSQRTLILLLGVILAVLVSVGLAFFLDYCDPSFRTPDEVEALLNIPVAAAMPKNGR